MKPRGMGRRTFLAAGAKAAAGAGAGALTACTTGTSDAREAAEKSTQTPADLRDWNGVRAQFLLDPEVAHFDAFILASHPASVRDSIERWRSALDADPARAVSDETKNDEMVRTAAARYLAVSPDEIALTDSTTMGLGLIYNGLRLSPGDHVLTSTHDFYSTHEALRLAAARSGAELEKIALYDDPAAASVDRIVSSLRAAVRPTTRLVALTWVHSSTGVKLPVRAVADMLAEVNAGRDPRRRALLSIDAIHGLGADLAAPGTLRCDIFVSGTHKWLFGPRGTGIVWAHRDAWDSMRATIPPFSGPSFGRWLFGERAPFIFGLDGTPGGYHSFEHRWALADVFDFHDSVGKDRIAARTSGLATRLKDGLAELPNVRVVTPSDPELSAGIVCVDAEGVEPGRLLLPLREDHGVAASITPYQTQYLRFGTSIVTSPEQVDAAVDAMAALT